MESGKTKSPFLEEVRELMRVQHYAIRTEQAYVEWIKLFILFHGKRNPAEMGESEIANFLTHLVVDRNVAPATQGQALNALIFLYRKVLNRPMGEIPGIVRSKKKIKIPVVLTRLEVSNLLSNLEGVHWLAGCLLYGSGLRLMECIRLRVSSDGVYSTTSEGYRFRSPVDYYQVWERRKGPCRYPCEGFSRTSTTTPGICKDDSRKRYRRGIWSGISA